MRLFRLILRWLHRLVGWKFHLPRVDTNAWQNKDEIYNDLKSHY